MINNFEKPNFEKTQEKSAGKLGITRREFLRGAAVAGVSAAILPGESLAKLENVLSYEDVKNENYEDGIRRLYEDVFQKKQEVHNFYFEAKKEFKDGFFKNGKSKFGWYEARGSRTSEGAVYVPRESFEVLFKDTDDFEEIKHIHTHPHESAKILKNQIISEGGGLDGEFIRPISFSSMDILNAIKLSREFPKYADVGSGEVIEPSGVWNYKLDLNNENLNRIFSEISGMEQKVAAMNERDKKIRKEVIVEILKEEKNLEISVDWISDKEIVDFEIQEELEWKKMRQMIDQKQKDLFRASRNERSEIIEKIIRELSEWGVEIKYRSMNPIKKGN